MGKSKDSGLGIKSNGGTTNSPNQVDDKTDELTKKNEPFDSTTFSYSESKTKYENYLLNKNHKDGGSKARFLSETLGYNKGDGEKLHNAISEAIDGKTPDKVTKTQFGTKYAFDTKIKGNNGKYHHANVTVVIQKDNGKIVWRIITIIPGKKDK